MNKLNKGDKVQVTSDAYDQLTEALQAAGLTEADKKFNGNGEPL